jgi:hypothetical protein
MVTFFSVKGLKVFTWPVNQCAQIYWHICGIICLHRALKFTMLLWGALKSFENAVNVSSLVLQHTPFIY